MTEVSAGIIVRGGQVLACRRRNKDGTPGLWEFPGGKREAGETAAECLRRECREELAIDLDVGGTIAVLDWDTASTRGTNPQILRHEGISQEILTTGLRFTFLLATLPVGEPTCLEHAQLMWLLPADLASLALCPPDAHILPQVLSALGQHVEQEEPEDA